MDNIVALLNEKEKTLLLQSLVVCMSALMELIRAVWRRFPNTLVSSISILFQLTQNGYIGGGDLLLGLYKHKPQFFTDNVRWFVHHMKTQLQELSSASEFGGDNPRTPVSDGSFVSLPSSRAGRSISFSEFGGTVADPVGSIDFCSFSGDYIHSDAGAGHQKPQSVVDGSVLRLILVDIARDSPLAMLSCVQLLADVHKLVMNNIQHAAVYSVCGGPDTPLALLKWMIQDATVLPHVASLLSHRILVPLHHALARTLVDFTILQSAATIVERIAAADHTMRTRPFFEAFLRTVELSFADTQLSPLSLTAPVSRGSRGSGHGSTSLLAGSGTGSDRQRGSRASSPLGHIRSVGSSDIHMGAIAWMLDKAAGIMVYYDKSLSGSQTGPPCSEALLVALKGFAGLADSEVSSKATVLLKILTPLSIR
jgi:hypothetical protein